MVRIAVLALACSRDADISLVGDIICVQCLRIPLKVHVKRLDNGSKSFQEFAYLVPSRTERQQLLRTLHHHFQKLQPQATNARAERHLRYFTRSSPARRSSSNELKRTRSEKVGCMEWQPVLGKNATTLLGDYQSIESAMVKDYRGCR